MQVAFLPKGSGKKSERLSHIKSVWTKLYMAGNDLALP